MKTITDCRNFAKICKAFLFTLILGAGLFTSSANAQTLTSDHLDYAPGDTAILTGTGFQPGETVTVQVVNADNSPNSNDAPFNVTANASGSFVTIWIVPADSSALGQLLLATADGQTSGLHAECSFTDAVTFDTIDFHQASNQDHPTVPISWINGILNPNNSDYFEGIGVPQRVLFTGIVPTPGDTHALTLRHQALKGGVHAYDFIISWSQAVATAGAIGNGPVNELQNLFAQQCNGAISAAGLGVCTTATNDLGIDVPDNMGDPAGVSCGFPPPLSVNPAITCFEGIYGNRQVHVFGDQPVTWGEMIFNGYAGSGDVYATYTLRWKSASTNIKIELAGRASQSCVSAGCCGYGSGCGSGSVSGGPYHFKLDDFDGHTTGAQDNQLQANAATPPPTCDSVTFTGPDTVCPHSTNNIYSNAVNGCSNGTHHWTITGEGSIVGSATGSSVSVTADSCGTFTLCDTITCDEGQLVCCQTISVVDNLAPVLTCPTVSNVECPATPSSFGNATATDNCDGSPAITFSSVTTPGNCPQEFSVTRTWTASDECGNSSTCSRTIAVEDNTPPVITCPTVANVECPNTPNFGAATATDACDNSVVPTASNVTTPGNCPQEFSVTRTWTATDDCGNSSTCSRTISVTDDTPPVITCPTVANVECPNTPNFGAATATDACDNSVVPTFSSVTTPGNCPQEFSVTRTWTATDDCGNSSTCSRTISVTDDTPPVITCPTVANVECPATPNFGAATATDACDNSVTPTFSNVTTPGNCPQEFSITRTWTATDDCGNSSTCSRTISVTDNTPPVISCPNTTDTVNCPAQALFSVATASDACDNSVVPTFSDNITSTGCPFTITRTWTATDDCGNSSTCSRTITVQDTTPPTITCPAVANVECPNTPSFGAASASDACDNSVAVNASNVTTPGNCPQEFSVTRTWTATDDCNNSSTCSRTISVTDDTPPVITCPTVANVECPATPNFGAASATDACDNSVIPTFSNVTTPGNCPQEFSVTRTWTATDDCGNSSTCSRTISVTDDTPPVITCPTVANVECPNTPNFGAATATDLCDNSVVPTFSNVTTPGACPQEFSVTRTWTATDDCGNASTCSRTISVTDDTPPVITCPTVANVECPATPNFGAATATDACDNSVVPTFSNVTTPGACPQEFSVTRTWTATDDCGNASTCSRTISVTDDTPPVITCPTVANVECPNTPNFGAATATDLCDNSVVPTFSNVTTPGACPQEFSVTRTWTATDDCGNSSTCSRTISVTDDTPPVITCPTVANVECPNAPNFGAATASDACDNSVVPTFSNVTTPGACPQEFSVTRTWTATDDCGNASTCSRTISVTDDTPPVITCPTVANVECPNTPNFGAATATDLCDNSVVPTFSNVTTPGACPQEFSVTRTWTATDDCGNSSTCSRTISVTDDTPPVITCPTVANVECPNAPNFGAATATDACDNSVVPTFSNVTTPGNCPQEFSVTRTWTATDDCGNSSTCSRTISVTDDTPPVITCPTVSNVECPNPINFGAATATDACDNSVVPSFSDVTTSGNCPFTVTRTWTATDDCGNSSTCSRTISVTDNTPPVITCPTVANVECPGSPSFGAATATDACDISVVPTFSTVTTPGACPQEFSVTRTWTATDDCNNSSTCSRTISVTDNTPPVITCPTVQNVECPASPSFGAASATDACDNSVVPTFSNVTTPGNCPQEFSVTRTWTATDDCGNASTCSRTISVTDDTPPVITCPTVANVECPNTPNFGAATATDLCDNSVVPTFSNVTTPGACPQEFSVTRTWTATDDCGNSSTCSRTISVSDDTPPVITCPTVANVECPNTPNFGAATATDLCDNSVVPTFSNVTTPGACPQEFSVTRTWTATDDCGNSSTCSRTISVSDDTPPVITCPTVANVECPNTPNFGAATATDLCDNSVVPTFSNVTTPGACPQEFSVTRTWTATDDCGNSSTCSRTISVTDDTPPVITCPTVQNVECPASPSFGSASATDACDNSVVPTFSTVTTPGACPQEFSLTRTWTATDDCGNASTCSRTISVTDNTPPVITCPTVANVECPNAPNFGAATATDLCDNSVTPTFSNVTTPGNCPQEFSVTRTWTATDDCGNASTCSRTISVTDNTPPTLTCADNDTIACGDPVIFTDPTPADACDQSVSFSVLSASSVTNPDGSVDSCTTWQATDDCGNTAQCTQCIHINPCNTLFCTYTQGFWGNSGGHDCLGNSKPQLINDLLTTPLVIGCNGNTMTFGIGQGQCVIDRLPGGGPSVPITGNNTCSSIVGIALHSGNPARFRNTLLAQTIALELNVRYNNIILGVDLGGVHITGQYMTLAEANGCDSSATPGPTSVHTISQTVINYLGSNNTIDDLLALANQALCGALVPGPGVPTLSDINGAVSAFNEGLDECRFLIGFSNTLRDGVHITNNNSPISLTAYPNPFNSSTMISFSMDKSHDNLKLEIFNATGEVVAVPFNGSTEEGVTYTAEFDGANYPAGVYIYRVTAGSESYFDKLILIK